MDFGYIVDNAVSEDVGGDLGECFHDLEES